MDKNRLSISAAARTASFAFTSLLSIRIVSTKCAADYYGRHSHWGDDDGESSDYEAGEVLESSLTADHWIDPNGKRLRRGEIAVEEDELLDPEALRDVEPEEDFEGYTGNAGMTL